MNKKFTLNGLTVKSFVTKTDAIVGGGAHTEQICPTDTVCSTEGTAGCSIGGGTTYVGIGCAYSFAGTCTCPKDY